MKIPLGSLALVGSGEYTYAMESFEKELINFGKASGKTGGYVQIATAAGNESPERLRYWEDLGKAQADRIGVESHFLPIFNSENVNNPEFIEVIKNASLIYFSGGNPVHLARTFHGTKILDAIKNEFATGTALAGCSAGAMAMSDEAAIHWRKNKESHDGFSVVPQMRIFPHYDRYFANIPLPIRNFITKSKAEVFSIGIDENTALLWREGSWTVHGKGSVHILGSHNEIDQKIFKEGELLNFLPAPTAF